MSLKKVCIYFGLAALIPLTVTAEDIYKAPKIKLDEKKGQTAVIEKEKWNKGKLKIEGGEFQQRSPSSIKYKKIKRKSSSPYWIWNPKHR